MTRVSTQIAAAVDLLTQSKYAVALTGAGVSTPSGIPDFRSADSGLWKLADPMAVASIVAFRRRPENFYDWIKPHTQLILEAKPNAAHLALAHLEAFGPIKCVITQNIDMLHAKAGSATIYEVHGHLREVTCLQCYGIFDAEPYLADFIVSGEVPHCSQCNGVLKPNVILFGELLPASVLNRAKQQIHACDLMLVAGSSLETVPVSDLPLLAKRAGAQLIIVNLSETYVDHLADVVIHADVADVLPLLAAAFLEN
jgi:NAD-dependent deacetylase